MTLLRAVMPAFLLAGCATSPMQLSHGPIGRDFPQSAFSGFILDATSLEEAEAALGPPANTTNVRALVPANSKSLPAGSTVTLTTVRYLYWPNGAGLPVQAHPSKSAALIFLNGRLIAYSSDSTIPGQANGAVDEAKLGELRQCQTTRGQAISLLGAPNGQQMHVMDAQAGATDIFYRWSTAEGGVVTRRNLRISFDRNGTMSTYTMVDNQNGGANLPMPAPAAPPAGSQACPGHGAREPT